MNHPAARFRTCMHRLALVAMVLMVLMPVVGRWQQANRTAHADAADMCLHDGLRAALDDGHAGHGLHHDDRLPGDPVPQQQGHDDHDHGAACGYCTLATRLLPVLALVLALPLPVPVRPSAVRSLPVPPVAAFWFAHSPRGPPANS